MATPKLKLGNDKWATKSKSLLAFNDEGNNFKSLPFNVERLSGGSYVGRNGLIQYAATEEPRIDFTNYSKGALLLEPQRTNLQVRSEEFENSAWSKTRITVTDDNVTSPNGGLNASKLAENTSGTNAYFIDDLYGASGGTYTFSCFLKKGTLRYAGIRALTNNFGNRHFVLVDLENGNVTSTNTSGSGVTWGYNVDNYGNGWYRLSVTGSHTSSNVGLLISGSNEPTPSYGGVIPSYSADGNGNFYAWGAQVEAGDYSTSYIPTAGSAATRVQDYIAKGGNEYIFNDSEGVLYAEIQALANDQTYRFISISDNSTSSNRVVISYNTNSNQIRCDLIVSGSTQSSFNTNSYDITQKNKVAIKYELNNVKMFVNGLQVGTTDTSANVFPSGTLNQINFDNGNLGSTFYYEGFLNDLQYFDEALTDAELQTLTTL